MIYSDQSPITFHDPLPEAVDVVVIGAGIAGISTAYFLAQKGQKVLVCEKGRVAGEQSSRNWGWIRQQGRDLDELSIMQESIHLWQNFDQLIGDDLGFSQQGIIYLADDEKTFAADQQWAEDVKGSGLDIRPLTSSQVADLIPGSTKKWHAGTYTPTDARGEPTQSVPAIARLCQSNGVVIRENCAVRTIQKSGGQITAVVTEEGPVQCSAVVCATGAWSSLFLRNLGIDLPQLAVRVTVSRTAPAPNVTNVNAADGELSFRRRQDGGYSVALTDYHEHFITRDSWKYLTKFLKSFSASYQDTKLRFLKDSSAVQPSFKAWHESESPFERQRVLNPDPCVYSMKTIRKRLDERFPALRGIPIAESWAGMIESTPDVVPVLDEVPGNAGLYVATGFSGHGFGIGPGAGRVMADLILGNDVGHKMERFRFNRFSDGSPLILGPAL